MRPGRSGREGGWWATGGRLTAGERCVCTTLGWSYARRRCTRRHRAARRDQRAPAGPDEASEAVWLEDRAGVGVQPGRLRSRREPSRDHHLRTLVVAGKMAERSDAEGAEAQRQQDQRQQPPTHGVTIPGAARRNLRPYLPPAHGGDDSRALRILLVLIDQLLRRPPASVTSAGASLWPTSAFTGNTTRRERAFRPVPRRVLPTSPPPLSGPRLPSSRACTSNLSQCCNNSWIVA